MPKLPKKFARLFKLQKPQPFVMATLQSIDGMNQDQRTYSENMQNLVQAQLDLNHEAMQKTLWLTLVAVIAACTAAGASVWSARQVPPTVNIKPPTVNIQAPSPAPAPVVNVQLPQPQ